MPEKDKKDKKVKMPKVEKKQKEESYNSDVESISSNSDSSSDEGRICGWKAIDRGLQRLDLRKKKSLEELAIFDVIIIKSKKYNFFCYPLYYDEKNKKLYYTTSNPVETQKMYFLADSRGKARDKELSIEKKAIKDIIYLGKIIG